jgi:hypothetical protein
MPINEINGVGWASINEIDGVSAANIADVSGVDAPSSGVITTNLIQHWDFGNTSFYPGSGTTITDLSDPTKTGSLVNGTVVTTSGSATYADYDGVNDYVECSIVNTFGQNHTCEMWARFPNLSDIKRLLWVRNYQSNCVTTNGGYSMQFDAVNKKIWFTVMNNLSIPRYESSAVTASTNTWYHMVASINGSSLKFYWNGSLVSTHTSTTNRFPPCQTGLVCRTSAVTRNNGTVNTSFCTEHDIAELRIYTTNLSATDVTTNFDATKSKYGY